MTAAGPAARITIIMHDDRDVCLAPLPHGDAAAATARAAGADDVCCSSRRRLFYFPV
jgi:hypothetical protein